MTKSLINNICEKSLFSRLFEKYAKGLIAHLYYRYGNELKAQDVTQDAFIKLYENCAKVAVEKAKSFLYTTANNLMLNVVKHEKVVLKYQSIKPKDYTNESPEFLMRKEQFLEQYQKALSTLPEDQRSAFLLCKAEGKKHQEIADIMGISKKSVEYKIYSALNTLKNILEDFKLK